MNWLCWLFGHAPFDPWFDRSKSLYGHYTCQRCGKPAESKRQRLRQTLARDEVRTRAK